MAVVDISRAMMTAFSRALAYPGPALQEHLADLHALLEGDHAEAARAVEAFRAAAAELAPARIEEHYTRAFDLAPIAPPYLSIYLFGAENPKRGEFMAALNKAYAEAGYAPGGELPDHLAVVLGYAEAAPAAEWAELAEACLRAPVRHMRRALDESRHIYAPLLAALEAVIEPSSPGDCCHA